MAIVSSSLGGGKSPCPGFLISTCLVANPSSCGPHLCQPWPIPMVVGLYRDGEVLWAHITDNYVRLQI